MNKGLLGVGAILIGGAALVVFAVLIGVFGFFGFQNTAQRFENQIEAKYKDNQNVYDNGWKEVREKAQVPELYAEKLQAIYKDLIEGRKGNSGELVRVIQEANPTLDASMYVQIQQSIESFRGRFKMGQTELLAQKQSYQNYLTATLSGRFYNSIGGGYPKLDLSKYDIVTSGATDTAFETKKADEIQIKDR